MFHKAKDLLNKSKTISLKISMVKIQADILALILMRLRLWSLIVLPTVGFIFGQLLQLILHTRNNCKHESLTIHAISMIFMIAIFNDILYNPEAMNDIREKALFFCLSYLFILGTVLGIITYF